MRFPVIISPRPFHASFASGKRASVNGGNMITSTAMDWFECDKVRSIVADVRVCTVFNVDGLELPREKIDQATGVVRTSSLITA